jgi:serine/threonine protein kinase
MSFDADGQGVCPGCGEAGEIGSACDERVCERWGLHRIPTACVTWGDREAPPQHVGRLVGKILLVQELGSGGFGMVYLGLQLPVFLPVALKILHRNDDPRVAAVLLRKFEDEARALARLNHPNIVRLVDYGDHEGSPYLAMEYVPGSRNLKTEIADRVARGEGMKLDTIASIVRQTGDGLIAAHKKGLLHRDIKPENLMLQSAVGHPILVRIVDFGLAKFTGDGTSTSRAMGTPAYMAPEQLVQKDLGPWTDLYALGVLTFELLTGRRPFAGRTTQEIVAQKIDPDYDPLTRAADLPMPSDVRAFLKCAVAFEPKERFRNGAAFRVAFDRAITAYGEVSGEGAELQEMSALVDASDLEHAESARVRREREAAQAPGEPETTDAPPWREAPREVAPSGPEAARVSPEEVRAASAPAPMETNEYAASWLPKREATGERSTSPGRPEPASPSAPSADEDSGPLPVEAMDEDLLLDEGFRRTLAVPLLLAAGVLLLLLAGISWFILRTEERLVGRMSAQGGASSAAVAAGRAPDAGPSAPARWRDVPTSDAPAGDAARALEGAPRAEAIQPSAPASALEPGSKPASRTASWQQAKVRSKPKASARPKPKPRLKSKSKSKPRLKSTPRPKPKAKARPESSARAKARPKSRDELRVPAGTPEEEPPPPPPPPAPLSGNAARVEVVSDPSGANVSLNGRFKCLSPCAVTFKGKGPFSLKIERQAFDPWVRSYLSLDEVEREGGRLKVRLDMEL